MCSRCYGRGKQGRLLCFLTFLLGAVWCIPLSAHADVVISEIMYHHPEDVDYEYLELTNQGSGLIDLKGWSVQGAVSFRFEESTILSPGQVVLIGDDQLAVRSWYGVDNVAGAYSGNLANEGQPIHLKDPNGHTVLTLAYQPALPWPVEAAGLGRSLELIDLQSDSMSPRNWAVGSPYSPGQPNRPVIYSHQDQVVINEVMYHPQADTQDLEYIELFNSSDVDVDLSDWSLVSGILYTFPALSQLNAGAYLVIAQSPAALRNAYDIPQSVTVLGPYEGKLSNGGETIGLLDAQGRIADCVTYEDGGRWPKAADGQGSSLELIHTHLDNRIPMLWMASQAMGTPGRINSRYQADPIPLVEIICHDPVVPAPQDQVVVSARIHDEQAPLVVTLYYQKGSRQWNMVTMHPSDSDTSVWIGTIPPSAQGTVVAFYVTAMDISGNPSDTRSGHCLYQVDGLPHETIRQTYRIVMSEADYDELFTRYEYINDLLNCTFIAGDDVHYRAGIRLRGFSSRQFPQPKNLRVQFTQTDVPFRGLERLNLNGVDDDPRSGDYEFAIGSHELGHDFLDRAGQLTLDHQLIALILNNRFWPNYIYLSAIDDVYARLRFPGDDGNLYSCSRPYGEPAPHADLDYRGQDPDAYRPDYFKKTNEVDDDWTDLIELVDILNNIPDDAEYAQRIHERVNVDQWIGFFATINLIGYDEGGIHAGLGTEYSMYRLESTGQFHMIPWDFDENFHKDTLSIFKQTLPPIKRFIRHPEHVQLYYQKLRQLLDGPFSEAEMQKATERYRGLLQDEFLDQVNVFVTQRRAYVLSRLPE